MIKILIPLFIGVLFLSAIPSLASKDNNRSAEAFADFDGEVGAGIVYYNGEFLVGTEGRILRVTPEGHVSEFCNFGKLKEGKNYYFKSPLVWDMVIDRENHVLAAAQDRILRIAPDGTISELLREDFRGFLGASGIELDREGNIYVTQGPKIVKYTPDLQKTVVFDGEDDFYRSLFSMRFDPDFRNLYVSDFNSKTLLRIPVDVNGQFGIVEEVIVDPILGSGNFGAPLNIVFGDKGNIYVSIDGMGAIIKISPSGTKEFIRFQGANHYIAFGGKGFDEESLYFTTFSGKTVYKINVGERARK